MSRIVMFVFNDCRTDARVLRESASLAEAGHAVTIIARANRPAGVPDHEFIGAVEVHRVEVPTAWRFYWGWIVYPWRMRSWWAGRVRRAVRRLPAGAPELLIVLLAGLATLGWAILRAPFHLRVRNRPPTPGGSSIDFLVRWQWGVNGWAARAALAAPPADAYHGHDLTGLEAAGRAAQRHGQSPIVYDSHEIFVEAGSVATRPRIVKWLLTRRERRWTREAAALVTVNRALAAELGRRLRPARTVVVHNCPPRWSAPDVEPDLIRTVASIPGEDRIALYHGGFSAHRGLEELAAAVRRPGLERVHAVYLGYGAQRPMLDALAADPGSEGRVHVLDAVPPDELLPWVASADVAVMAIQASTLNHRLSTPNKLFEAIAAGVPVVASDFPEMRSIVMDDPAGPLGAVCRPDSVESIAAAIRTIVDLAPTERDALRGRIRDAARERWNWETEVARLVGLYADLAAGA